MIPFQRHPVGVKLIHRLASLVGNGESAVVLAPGFGGKRHLLREVCKILLRERGFPLISFSVKAGGALEGGVLPLSLNEGNGDESRTENPILLADRVHSSLRKPVILVGDGIDRFGDSYARDFLMQVRTRVQNLHLVVVLAGERDFRDLVHGPNSAFNCANQFFLHGFDRGTFGRYFQEYSDAMEIEWTDQEKAIDIVYQQTGGNGYLLRMMLSLVIDLRAKQYHADSPEFVHRAIDPADIGWDRPVRLTALPESYWAHLFRSGVEILAADPDCWEGLEVLTNGGAVGLKGEELGPDSLEFSGFFRLNEKQEYDFSSPVFRSFVKFHYTGVRFAALYGRQGDWDQAFIRFQRADPLRSMVEEDESEALLLLRSLEADMHSAASNSPDRVEWLFAQGCRWILGFPEIEKRIRPDDGWSTGMPDNDQTSRDKTALLGSMTKDFDLASDRWAIAVQFRLHRENGIRALIFSSYVKRGVVSSRRMALVKRLAGQFLEAYGHAVEKQVSVERSMTLNYANIVRTIQMKVGDSILNVKQALENAATMLLDLNYKRVAFALVDPIERRIVEAVCVPTHPPDLGVTIDYDLDREESVLPFVVRDQTPYVVTDAITDFRVDKKYLVQGDLKAFAVVPIFGRSEDVVGTIHVEREDGRVPGKQQIDDLVEFGRQLGGVLAGSERITQLTSALDKIREPIFLLNRTRHILFANEPARGLFSNVVSVSGWQPGTPLMPTDALGDGYVAKALTEKRFLRQLNGAGNDPEYRGQILCARLEDWRGVTVGGLIHIEDQVFLHKVYDAVAKIAEASQSTVIENILDATEALKFDRVRYYIWKADHLESRDSRGLAKEESRARFKAGEVRLAENDLPLEPVAWKWDKTETRDIVPNDYGLEQRIARTEKFAEILEKNEGAVWVDLPLRTDDQIFGKVILERAPDYPLRPEEFENIRVFGKLVSASLAAIADQKGLARGYEKAMGMMAHQFRNKFVGITGLLIGYEELAELNPSVRSLLTERNERFDRHVKKMEDILRRAPELLGTIAVRPEHFDLKELLTELKTTMQKARVNVGEESITIIADRHLLGLCFSEMIDNACQMRPGHTVTVTFSAFKEGSGGAVIDVADDGPGVASENKRLIFEEAFSLRPGARGTGWGLYFIKRVVEAHGGIIEEIQDVGKPGALFRLKLPGAGAERKGHVPI